MVKIRLILSEVRRSVKSGTMVALTIAGAV